MRVAFHTLGCKVNHYETEAMREAFVSRGAECVGENEGLSEGLDEGFEGQGENCPADVYIVNTCTVTNIADRKSRQYIRRVKRANPDALIVVTGCYAQVEPEEVANLPEVDIVVGNGQKSKICELVFAAMEERGRMACGGYLSRNDKNVLVLGRDEMTEYEDMGMVRSSEPGMTRAYIKVQEGCDRFCAYCKIPYARGPVRSRQPLEIIEEAAVLLDSGVHELVLTGINTALYGSEPSFWSKLAASSPICNIDKKDIFLNDSKDVLNPDRTNVQLGWKKASQQIIERFLLMSPEERGASAGLELVLAMLDAIELPDGRDFRVRLSSLEPTVVDRNDIEKIIKYRRLCHHLHLSVQNGSDSILKSMNRHYDRSDYLEIVEALRKFDPLYGITTDIIVGFPGEEDDDFADTLDIVHRSEFAKVHVFRYSPRKGTAGAALPDQVSGLTKRSRAEQLDIVSQVVAHRFMESNFGIAHQVLIEEIVRIANEGEETYLTGYTGNYIKVYIPIDGHETQVTESGEQMGEGRNILGMNVNNPRPGYLVNVQLTQIFEDGCLAKLA